MEIRTPEPVRFLVGVLCASVDDLPVVRNMLAGEWGEPDLEYGPVPFSHTDYYSDVMGTEIVRAFCSFPERIDPAELAARKVRTNAMEKELAARLSSPVERPVNLDPGYIAHEKLVLASAKNFSHRIYVGEGIYAEVTLQYRGDAFIPLEWTFPDYASGAYFSFLLRVREALMMERQAHGS